MFSPNWAASSRTSENLAYACYSFSLEGFDRSQQIAFSWETVGDLGDLWIGLADFTRDCWTWHSLPGSCVLAVDFDRYIDAETNTLLVLPLLTGTASWQLNKIHIGDLTSLSGHVWQDDGSTPLYEAEVVVSGSQEYTTRVDYLGTWLIHGVIPDDYSVSAHLIGWDIVPDQRDITVNGLEQAVGDFQGSPLPMHTASGLVVSAHDGEPLRAVEMEVTLQDSGYGSVSAWTEFDGTWAISLSDGDYVVTPSMAGWFFTPPSRSFSVAGTDCVVEDFSGEKLPGYLLDGYVYQADGETPLADVQVNAFDESAGLYFYASTDQSGYWSVKDAPDSEYALEAILYGWHFTPPSQVVTIDGADRRADPFVGSLLARHAVDGYVLLDDGETPVSGVNVQLSGPEGWHNETTNSLGHYVFTDICEGYYTAEPQSASYEFTPVRRSVRVSADRTLDTFLATTLPTFSVSGHIFQHDGLTGIEGVLVTVYAYIPAGTAFEAYSDTDGYWCTPSVPPGFFTVYPQKQGHNFEPQDRAIQVEDTDLVVDDFIGSALPSYTMDGHVYEQDGLTPVPGVDISVAGWSYLYETKTDAGGHWQLDEVFEDYYVVTPMLAPWRFVPADQEVEVSGADVTVPPFLGEQLPAWTVDGCIYEAESTIPVPDVEVWFYGSALTYRCFTDETGHYEVLLPNGDWEAMPKSSCWSFQPFSQLFTMSGEAQTLEVFYATPGG